MKKKYHLGIVKITSWAGSIGAEHLYAKLIYPESERITKESYGEWSIFEEDGRTHELKRTLTLNEAKYLDAKDDSYGLRIRAWHRGEKETDRFNDFEEIERAAIKKHSELKNDCPLVYMYHGDAIEIEEFKKIIKQ